jgi:PAS domain S-box-containing protein
MLSVLALQKNGRTISVEFTITPLTDESGAMIGMAAIMRDVTKRFEELRTLKRRLADATKLSQ